MKRYLFFVLFLSGMTIYAKPVFGSIEIKAEVDKKEISVQEELVYKVVVSATDEPLPVPEFPDFKGFQVISQANTSNIQIKDKSAKVAAVYVFILLPQESGKITIAPTRIKIKNKLYESESFEIEIRQAEKEAPFVPQGSGEKLTL